MALANSSILVTPGSGATHATHSVSAKDHPVAMIAGPDGHIIGSEPSYFLSQGPRVITAAVTDFFDLFNATGSGKVIKLVGLYPLLKSTAAWTQSTTFQFDIIRTSAVGTGGTVSTFEGAAAPTTGLVNIVRFSTADASTLPAQITCRALPTAGATAAAWLFSVEIQPEETNPASSLGQWVNLFPVLPNGNQFELQENQGVKVRQITTAGTLTGTSFGWNLAFTVIP